MTTTRRLAAILAADVAGYSRLMAVEEVGTLTALKAVRREVVDPAIAEHHGRIVKTTGDGMLVEFASAVDAVTCAMAVQQKMAARGGDIAFRIGINVGDIIIEGDDIFGDGVNLAARVENECEPGGVCLSAQAFDQVRNKTTFAFDDLGERQLKNIDRPIRLYATHGGVAAGSGVSLPEADKPLPLPDKPSIAVLPFQNMSGDPEQEYFADGMVEDITTALSRFSSLFVIARNSAFAYKGKAVDIKQVGRELGVRYLLEGSVRKGGGRVRITGQLVEADTGSHLWADKFDGSLDDVFDLQDRVTARVVGAVSPNIEKAELQRALMKGTDNLGAYDWYLRGRAVQGKGREGVDSALDCYRRAIKLDPRFARAYAAAASCCNTRGLQGTLSDEEIAEGTQFAEQAVAFGQSDAGALATAANFYSYVRRDMVLAEKLVEQALALNPNSANAWRVLGWISVWTGRGPAAIGQLETALRLSPIDADLANTYAAMAAAYNYTERPAEALLWVTKSLARLPDHSPSLINAIVACVSLGRMDEARSYGQRFYKAVGRITITQVRKAIPFQRSQDIELFVSSLRSVGHPE